MLPPRRISIFDAKTRFSEVINEIFQGSTSYIITNRGIPVAVIYPYVAEEDLDIEQKLSAYVKANQAVKAEQPWNKASSLLKKLTRKKGVLADFLKERE